MAEMRIDARAHGAECVVTTATVDPGLAAIAEAVAREIPLTSLHPPAFVTLDRAADLRRFSRYVRYDHAARVRTHATRNVSCIAATSARFRFVARCQ